MKALRHFGLVHRDIKPQNLLFVKANSTDFSLNNEHGPCSSFSSYILKVADFGFARYMNPSDMADTLCGSPLYMAPEILQNEKYDAKADLWSVGCIMFELLFARGPPFHAPNHLTLAKKYEDPELVNNLFLKLANEGAPDIWGNLSEECLSLLKGLLTVDPLERVSFEDFFSHPWLQDKAQSDYPKIGNFQSSSNPSHPEKSLHTKELPSFGIDDVDSLSSLIQIVHIDPLNNDPKLSYKYDKSNSISEYAISLFPQFLQKKQILNRILYSIQVFLVKLKSYFISICHFQLIILILNAVEDVMQISALLTYSEIFNKGRYLFSQYLSLAKQAETALYSSKHLNNTQMELILTELLYEINYKPDDSEWLSWFRLRLSRKNNSYTNKFN